MEKRLAYQAGCDLLHGWTSGVEDPDAAFSYFLRAASEGNSTAMVHLGQICEEKEDVGNAYFWYNEAALSGFDAGLYEVARMYHRGVYVRQDYGKARKYFEKVFEAGCYEAAFFLGLYYQKGCGVEKDCVKAIRYYREGADHGDGLCAVNLGIIYCDGWYVKKDPGRGFGLFLRGCKVHEPLAFANAGLCCEKGIGTAADWKSAVAFYREGAELGDEYCAEALKRLADN